MNHKFVTKEEIGKWYLETFGLYTDMEQMIRTYKNAHYPAEKEVCTYPKCNCPFDMGEDGKCLRGLGIEKQKDNNDDATINNGGKTDYYQLSSSPFEINDFDDFAEWRGMNGNQFNIGKVVWAFNVGRHSGTDYVRDLNKIIHYANRELDRLKREGK